MSDIYGQISGHGPALVLLHGFCETHHIWQELTPYLASDYKVFTPDLPGFGDSILHDDHFSLDLIAGMLKGWLVANKVTSCTMIGHSLGGYITLSFAKKYPEMVEKIGLFHSSVYEDDALKKSSRDKTIAFIEKNGVEVFVESFFHNLFYAPNLKKPYIQEKLQAVSDRARLLRVSVVNAYLAAMRDREDSKTWLATFTKPLLMIAGTEDTAVPVRLSREQAKISPEIVYYELTGSGHMGMFEEKEESFDIIRKFLKK